ncbi:MAG TPA: hypothetical protein EYN66_04900 [Myxococcales bacterium]|nr:hypothetical protein [Myxococcales bacterium]
MATNTVVGNLICSDGTNIPLKLDLVEGTETNLTTDVAYTVTAANVGDFAPGKTVVGGLVSCDTGVGYSFILSQGLVAAIIPWSIKGAVTDGQPALCQPYTLKAGDIVRCMSQTAADRGATAAVYTARGVSRIFHVTPSGGATNELVDLQTGNSIGDTLQGDRIVKWYGTSVDGALIETQGFYAVDALGNVIGSCSATDPATQQPAFAMASVPIQLNFKFQFLTNA